MKRKRRSKITHLEQNLNVISRYERNERAFGIVHDEGI
jgi:hypothetical protein